MSKLFVSNIPINYTTAEIQELFTVFGPLKSIKPYITQKKEENSMQSVFIEYLYEKDANEALDKFKNQKFFKNKILIKKAFERKNKIYVGRLDDSITKDDLYEHFNSYGKIISIQREKENNYAFVVFEDEKVADLLIQSHGKKKIGNKGSVVHVKRAYSKIESTQKIFPYERSVIVKNLPPNLSEKNLIEFFKDVGIVEKVQFNHFRAVIVFNTELSALKAIKYKNKKNLLSRKVNIVMYNNKRENK